MYKIDLKEKTLLITMGGFFTPDEAKSFIDDYEKTVSSMDTKGISLILDGSELKASTQDMLPMLQQCMEMYMRDNFKKVIVLDFDSSVTNSQITRVAKSIGFDQRYQMVATLDEALKAAL